MANPKRFEIEIREPGRDIIVHAPAYDIGVGTGTDLQMPVSNVVRGELRKHIGTIVAANCGGKLCSPEVALTSTEVTANPEKDVIDGGFVTCSVDHCPLSPEGGANDRNPEEPLSPAPSTSKLYTPSGGLSIF